MNDFVSSVPRTPRPNLIIVGGGLSGGLLAACLRHRRPGLRVTVVEKEARVGGNHTWSFHGSDVAAESWPWLASLVSKSWEAHSVRFPDFDRAFDSPYHSIRSGDFHANLSWILGEKLRLAEEVAELGPDWVQLAGGERLEADAVIDARGWKAQLPMRSGFQKFVGLDLTLANGHGLNGPILMDARVPQLDGFRFFYVLPWDEKSLLVEDTRYSDNPDLDERALEVEILAYSRHQGWRVETVGRQEKGVLPIPLEKPRRPENSIGARSHSYQDTTGFTLPDCVRLAESIAEIKFFSPGALEATLKKYERRRLRPRSFLRALNRMLFTAALPAQRYRVLQRFYTLPAPTIGRFYAGKITWPDAARILSGKPPVPLWKGIAAAMGKGTGVSP